MASLRSFRLRATLALLLLASVLYLARTVWLGTLGNALVHDEGPAPAAIVVVLAGDPWGFRLTHAAELVRHGYAPRVLVSGPPGTYEINEADAAIHYGTAHGYPAEWFIPLRHTALSTDTEAQVVLEYLRQHQVPSFLLVTSNFHTARARRIYLAAEHRMGGGPSFRTVASPDRFFTPGGWWQSREGRKTTFLEWTKTITGPLGF